MITAADMLKSGGAWLAVMREFMQRKANNGERVTWGSSEFLQLRPLTVSDMEHLAASVAAATVSEVAPRHEREVKKLKGQMRIQEDYATSRVCVAHRGHWERGWCAICEVYKLREKLEEVTRDRDRLRAELARASLSMPQHLPGCSGGWVGSCEPGCPYARPPAQMAEA